MAANEESALRKLEQRNHELAILRAIAEELNRAVDTKTALENALALVGDLLGLKSGWVWLVDETTGEPYLAASRMLPPFLTASPARMRGSDCYCLSTFLAGDLTGAANVKVIECSRLKGVIEGNEGLHYHASIPIYAHDKRLGVMNVAGPDWHRLDESELQLLYIIGYQVGIAVERARLFDQTTRLATTEERNRLAREIHDTIAQGLAATIFNLESADMLLDNPDKAKQKKGREKLSKALALTRANLEEARRSVLDLRAAPLQEKVLAEALEALVVNFGRDNSLETHFAADDEQVGRRFPARIEAGVYRVAQEALNNIHKHAGCRKVRVSLQTELLDGDEQLRLVVEDDGQGFNPAELTTSAEYNLREHFGLVGMNERARLMGGQLEIRSQPGAGTGVILIVPI